MSNNQSESIAGDTTPDGNLSATQLIAGLAQTQDIPAEGNDEIETNEQDVIETDTSADIESDELDESDEIETEEDENQDFDIESLTPEQIQQIAKKGKSRLLQRIGELTAKNKALEEQSRAEAKPLPKPIADNPFASLKTRAEVESKIEEMEKVAEETDSILDEYEDYGSNDIITVGGKEYTKKEIKTANRNARNSLLKLLPAQLHEIERSERGEQARQQLNAMIPVQIPELADEESPLSLRFKASKDDPAYKELLATSAGPQIDFLIAHALRSIQLLEHKNKLAPTVPGEKPKPKVAGNPVGAGARSISQSGKSKNQLEAYDKTGKADDLIKLLS